MPHLRGEETWGYGWPAHPRSPPERGALWSCPNPAPLCQSRKEVSSDISHILTELKGLRRESLSIHFIKSTYTLVSKVIKGLLEIINLLLIKIILILSDFLHIYGTVRSIYRSYF